MATSIVTTAPELYLPALALDYGIYELRIQVGMVDALPLAVATASVYVTITPSNIRPYLMPFGTSNIVHTRAHDLLLDPGAYSDDPDALTFNASVRFHQSIEQLA